MPTVNSRLAQAFRILQEHPRYPVVQLNFDRECAEVRRLYQQGVSVRAIAAQVGIPHMTVQRIEKAILPSMNREGDHEFSDVKNKRSYASFRTGDRERFALEALKFHIQAKAYLSLVDDRTRQDAFGLALEWFALKAWERYSGMSADFALPEELTPFREFVAYWRAVSHIKLADCGKGATEGRTDVPPTA